jgi:hypothetical protein
MSKKQSVRLSDSALVEILERGQRYFKEGHEQQAMEELRQWSIKWRHTKISQAIAGAINQVMGKRRPRGAAFPEHSIVTAVVLLEKIGISTPVAKKTVAHRFCTTVRNVEHYLQEFGDATRKLCSLAAERGIKEPFSWDELARHRLTQEEARKLNEIIFHEK